jgi:hypothetical protein
MKPRLTEWFGPEAKPTIPGVYQTDVFTLSTVYQKWDGHRWGSYANSVMRAENDGDCASGCQRVKWRGLAEKPE